MTTQIALCHCVKLTAPSGLAYRFQNFFIGGSCVQSGETYQFAPFGFSGVTFNRSGENSEATVVFANKDLIREFVNNAVLQKWTVEVLTCAVTDIEGKDLSTLYSYVGSVSGGVWKGESLGLSLTSILDAVTANVPTRNLEVSQVGPLPISGGINL
jgi:hypothetical protein